MITVSTPITPQEALPCPLCHHRHHLPHTARLRDRQVFEDGVWSVYDYQILREKDGFAFAQAWDGGRYLELVLPTDHEPAPTITDTSLLVEPSRAVAQRKREVEELGEEETDGRGQVEAAGRVPSSPPSGPAPKSRYFGVPNIGP
ncbi:hypothetical protein MSM1_20820 [Mycobacterium sp. SM1]|uniref:hypothetical protein n=1 Tax=Mycobacterium sp. SM1 TaxID=2816243 RepID=UPI001BD1540C|nr:hypothetical protein [Mycobacterium sp. SM1]MBS4730651.1 hypothetical protein [Mycobacterium sp. SM1]